MATQEVPLPSAGKNPSGYIIAKEGEIGISEAREKQGYLNRIIEILRNRVSVLRTRDTLGEEVGLAEHWPHIQARRNASLLVFIPASPPIYRNSFIEALLTFSQRSR